MSDTIIIASVMRPRGETGIQTHFGTFRRALHESGHAVTLLTPYDEPRWRVYPVFGLRKLIAPLSPAAGIRWYRCWHAHFLESALRRRLAAAEDCVIYAQCPLSARAALRSRAGSGQRIVAAVHFNISEADEWAGKGMLAPGGRLFDAIRMLEADVLPRVDGLMFVSAFMRTQLIARIPAVASLPYAIVPNFVNDPGAAPVLPSEVGSDVEDEVDLISIGTLEPRKNHGYLLEIIAAARGRGERLRLTLVGDGPDRAELESRARRLNIANQVHFTGFVANAAELLARHAAYIHVARIENLPLTLVEALSRGVPIFAPAVGGIPEIFDDGVEGRVLPLDDAPTAARLITEWLKNRRQMAQAAKAARSRFLRQFQTAVAAARLTAFLEMIGSGTAAPVMARDMDATPVA